MIKSKFILISILLVLAIFLAACSSNSVADEIEVGNPAPDFALTAADGSTVTTVDELLPFLEEKGHPALTMDPII